jgi:hypothetical protein
MTVENPVPVPADHEGADLATRDDPRYPVPDPGHEEHLPRLSDVDEKAADRATRQVATFFGLVPLLAIGFVVIYFAVPATWYVDFGFLHTNAKNLLLGLTFGLALLFIGIGAVQWARQLMADEEMVEHRHGATSKPEDVAWVVGEMDKVVDESRLTRRKVIGRSLLGALGAIILPMLVGLADLGPWPTNKRRAETIETTIWGEGIRLVNDVTYEPIKPEDIEIGQLVNGQPENLQDFTGRSSRSRRPRPPSSWSGWTPTASRSRSRAGTGTSTASCATRRSAPMSAARSASGSSRPTTCSALATSRPSTSATRGWSSSALPRARCRSCRSLLTARDTWWHAVISQFP